VIKRKARTIPFGYKLAEDEGGYTNPRLTMVEKVYANEHPKYKKKTKTKASGKSKSYSEADILEWNRAVKEKAEKWDAGEVRSKMPVLTGEKKDIIYNMKKIDPKKRRVGGKLTYTEV